MKKLFKLDQEIFNRYMPGKVIKASYKTPNQSVRIHTTTDSCALCIATEKQKSKVAGMMALVAANRKMNLSIHTERNHVICTLSS